MIEKGYAYFKSWVHDINTFVFCTYRLLMATWQLKWTKIDFDYHLNSNHSLVGCISVQILMKQVLHS